MPYESVLFYTNAEEVNYLDEKIILNQKCNNYLLTPENMNKKIIFQKNRLKLYLLN